jgi:hypothetical protein
LPAVSTARHKPQRVAKTPLARFFFVFDQISSVLSIDLMEFTSFGRSRSIAVNLDSFSEALA